MIINPYISFPTSTYTARTLAFATATGISDVTILSALSTFDTGLIANSLDTKIKALYPFVGGSATTCKYNFFDARDLDAAYRLGFNGGITFDSGGYTPNGSTGYADTYFVPNVNFVSNTSISTSVYSKTNTSGATLEVDLGAYSTLALVMAPYQPTNITNTRCGSGGNNIYADTNSLGYYIQSRHDNISEKTYKSGVLKGTLTAASSTLPNVSITLSKYNFAGFSSTRKLSFAHIGDGLIEAEVITFSTLVETLQTNLGR